MWVFLKWFLLLQQTPTQTTAPTLVVHVVDPARAQVPGAEVTVRSFSGKAKPIAVRADNEDYAKFWIDADKDYSIDAIGPGFKTKHLERVHVFKPGERSVTRHVEFRTELSGPMTTVY